MRHRNRHGHGGPPHWPSAGVAPLTSLPEGAAGFISALATKDPERLQKLMAFGILPGTPIRLLQRRPAYVFQVGQTQVAVDERIAADILVAPGSS